ncbi:MAG: TonB-dependent receptor plug domain-containing protein [Polyangiaceae bacterium]
MLLCYALLCMIQLSAQTTAVTVNGVVKDEQGKPLPNVSVRETTSKNGVITKEDGSFTIKTKNASSTLEFTYVGYAVQKFKLSGQADISITLKEDAASKNLQDVVVVGTQRQTKKTTTTAISSLSGKVIENLPAPSVDVLLQGRISGMNVQVNSGEPGVAPTVVVRGNSRVNTNINDNSVAQAKALSGPLYVIDGIPVNPEDISNAMSLGTGGASTGTNYMAGININDIESIDVQKDAAATAAWGSRGANGVIYIKTKRGRFSTPEFRVNVYGGVTLQPKLITTYTGAEERSQKMNVLRQYATPAQMATLPQILTDSLNPYFNNAIDWQGLFYRTGAIKNVDATVSAASDIVNYRLSMNYYNEKGIIEAYGYKRYSLRGNFDFKISPKLNSQLIVALSRGDRQRVKN